MSGSSPEFVITAIWLLIGIALAMAAGKKGNTVSNEEREVLIFGELYARRGGGNEK